MLFRSVLFPLPAGDLPETSFPSVTQHDAFARGLSHRPVLSRLAA